ncbi:MAG: MmcQ/YjbR family DNA-binding protein [Saprospiraceae bacterium]
MDFDSFHAYCAAKKGVEETFPFDEVTLVFKVMGKMFALCGLDNVEFSMNLKCDPERAVQLREEFPDEITPGYHMSKVHWNTVYSRGGVPEALLYELIDHSYDLVVASLPKKTKELLNSL